MNSWLSVHLYYNEPWETFLVESVAPYIQTILKTEIATSYFFIRYWEKGPHIRLRLKGEKKVLDEVVKPNLTEYFQSYMETHPSKRTEPDYPEGFSESDKWRKNNAIYVEGYILELNRYGGKEGLNISETQFQLSSETILQHFKEQESHYEDVLGFAIRLHLGFVHSLGMNLHEATQFFNMIFENWLPNAFELFEANTPDEIISNKMNEMMTLFEDSFLQQKDVLVPFHRELMEDLNSEKMFESDNFNTWLSENKRLALLLKEAAESENLAPRTEEYEISPVVKSNLTGHTFLLWNIWADYVHMSNNRLGILNQDEAYLAYLIKRSLENLSC